MWRNLVARPLVLGSVALSASGSSSGAASNHCVMPIGVQLRGPDASDDRPVGPTRFDPGSGASTPLAIDEIRNFLPDGKYTVTKRYWRYRPDRRFEGPYAVDYRLEPAGTDGRLIYLKGGRDRTDTPLARTALDGKHWESRLFVAQPGGLPEMVGGDVARPQWSYSIKNYRADLGGVVVRASFDPKSGPDLHQYLLVTGTRARPISDEAARPRTLFPRWNLSVSAEGNHFRLIGPNRRGGQLTLPHSDDFRHWESLNIDRDGWLFAEGWGNDYAIKWQHRDGGIKVDRVVRFTGTGWFGRLVRWLLPAGPVARVSSTHHSAQCVDFSPVLQLTLFCKPAKVLRDGQLAEIGDGDAPLKRYIGDSTGARVALFRGEDNGLYAFDGKAVQKLAGVSAELMAIHDFPDLGRTFVAGRGVTAEIVGRFPHLRLRPIDLPTGKGRFTFPPGGMTIKAIAGDRAPLAFTAAGVWAIEQDGAVTPIWQAVESPVQVSEVTPAGVWKGLIFRTQAGQNMLVEPCAADRRMRS